MANNTEIRPGLKIRCNTKGEAQTLFAYLDSLGYFWRDGHRLVEDDRFDRLGNGICYALRERDGARTVVLAEARGEAVDFADIRIPERHCSGIDCLTNHPEVAVHCATFVEAERLIKRLENGNIGGARIFLEKCREGCADCCRVTKEFGGMPFAEAGRLARYAASRKYRLIEHSDLFGIGS